MIWNIFSWLLQINLNNQTLLLLILQSCLQLPQVIARAASTLTADLQFALGQIHNYGYTRFTMDSLRSNHGLVFQATQILTIATQNVPPLNQVLGWGLLQILCKTVR